MALELYNSLGKKIEPFESIKPGEVSMYVCGITPYDTTHLGHAFTYLSFDVLNRYLTYKGNKVKYVQNVTDVDDDILRKAGEEGRNWKELGESWTDHFLKDMKELNWIAPDPYVKATDAIPGIIKMVSDLEERGFAYENEGNVYYSVEKFPAYGELSRYHFDEMIRLSGERGADPKDPHKKDPRDFILWQKAKPEEPTWESPWGAGRPGWHIECSEMSESHLGTQIDIHGGGDDLIYPHHESEIAQSESYTGVKPFVKFWLHTGSVDYMGHKMSKSLKNLVMVSDLLKEYSGDAIRLMLISNHWQGRWEYKSEDIEVARLRMDKLQKDSRGGKESEGGELDSDFVAAMDANLNVPKAIELLEAKKLPNLAAHLKLLGFKL